MEGNSLDTLEEVQRIVQECMFSNESEENARLVKKCIQKAVFFKDKELEFEARLAYIYQMNWLNYKDQSIAMFPWLLKAIDTNEDVSWYNLHYVLWMYKWIIHELPDFAHISIEKIETLLDDMDRRIQDRGCSDKMGNYFRMIVFGKMGHLDKSKEYRKRFEAGTSEKEEFDDCKACQPYNVVTTLFQEKEYELANTYFEPLLNKEVTCKEVPKTSFPIVALMNRMLGKKDDAKQLAYLAKRNTPFKKKAYLSNAGYILMYYAMENDFIKGRDIIEKQLPFTNRKQPEQYQFIFYSGCLLLIQAMKNAGKKKITINIDEESIFPVNEKNAILLEDAFDIVEEKTNVLAQQLDKRNGNTFNQDNKTYWLGYLK